MVNKEANIDLLFRNGLKDYEVLPPEEVWNNILPVLRKRQRPVIILRVAALIAVLLSVSFIAYQLSREISLSFQNQLLALDEESFQQPNSGDITQVKNTPVTSLKNIRNGTGKVSDQRNDGNLTVDENIGITSQIKIADIPKLAYNDDLLIPRAINVFRDFSPIEVKDLSEDKNLTLADYDIPKQKINNWSITAMASPTYYMRPELHNSDISKQISSSEQSRISYSGGVAFAYKIGRKLSIQSGLYYSSVGNEVDGINSFAGFHQYNFTKGDHNFEVLTSSGRIYTNNSDVFLWDNSGDRVLTKYNNDIFDPNKAQLSYLNSTLYQNFSYLEMPVILRYKLIDKAVDFNLIGGLSYNLLVNNSVHTVIDGSRYDIGKTAGLNPFLVSSSLGMGMEYSLSDKFSLNLEPTFRYYLNPFGEIPGLRSHPYSFGIFSGLSYKF